MSSSSSDNFLIYERPNLPSVELESRSQDFCEIARQRRSIRSFSSQSVPKIVIENCLRAAGTAPSGANQQPWHFVAVSDAETKRRIRHDAEKEEHEFYHGRAPDAWLQAVAPMGTDEHKPFLETAPWLIAVFAQSHREAFSGSRREKNYYVTESVGIATGILISALNFSGLSTLTHTPSPMRFLNEILDRPSNERPFLLLVVGFPAEGCRVPDLKKKSLDEIATFLPASIQ